MAMPVTIGGLTLFTVEELAEVLDIQERSIRSFLRTGQLKGRKLAGRWYITEDALRDYFEQPEEPEDTETASAGLLTPEQAAQVLGITPRHLRRLLRGGQIKGKKQGSRWFVTEAALQAYLERSR